MLGRRSRWRSGAKQLRLLWGDFVIRNEADYKRHLFQRLNRWFEVKPEVPIDHVFGRRLRIDAVLIPRFLDPSIRMGLEVKAFHTRADVSIGDYAAALKQSIDYSMCVLDGRPLDMVLVHPGILAGSSHEELFRHTQHVAIRLAAPFRVGELSEDSRYGFEIRIGGSPLWRSNAGGLTGIGQKFKWRREL